MRPDEDGPRPRALVIGASAGIGRATAVRLCELGFDVAAVGRRSERLDELQHRTGARPIVADLADSEQCRQLVGQAAEQLGGFDLIVHAASSSGLSLLEDTDAEAWHAILQLNVVAPALMLRAALPHLARNAVCALISSEIVGNPYAGLTPYAVSKAALEELVRGWREEHPELRFCALRVGATDGTEFARGFDPEIAASLLPRWIAQGRIPDQFIDVIQLGNAIAQTLDLAARSPTIDVQDLVIRAAGGAGQADVAELMDKLEEHRA